MLKEPKRKDQIAKSIICCALAAMALASLLVVYLGSNFMVSIPCVAGSTCDEVAKLRISNPFGIPLSLIGAIIATMNMVSSIGWARFRSEISNITIGTGLISICLQIYIRSSLHLNCIWCLVAALSLVCSGTLNRSLNTRSIDMYVLMSVVSLVGAGVFLIAQVLGANSTSRSIVFTQAESIRLSKMAQGKKYIVFSCISCPACKTMYNLVLHKPIAIQTRFSYLDVHRQDKNFELQTHFNQLLIANKLEACRKLLEDISGGLVLQVPKASRTELQELIDQQNAAIDLKIKATPTVIEIIDESHSIEVPVNQYLLR